jgi:hypothetical protein
MLSKLIKYDIRSTWRDFAGVYLSILLGVLILPPLFNHFNNPFVNTVAGFIATGIVIATIVVMILTLFKIFNRNVLSKEGYLTMTLPVTSAQIVVSKLLVSTMWIILTGIVSAIGICIFVLNMNVAPLTEIYDAIQKVLSMIDSRGVLAIILMVIAMIASAVKEIAKLFLACSIAHLKQLNRFRVPAGILSYFVFSWLETLIVQAVGLIVSFWPCTAEYTKQLELMNDPSSIQQFIGIFSGVLGVGILYAFALTAVYGIGTVWLLNHKLDLD